MGGWGGSETNLALLSLRHESRGGGGDGQPGPVPGTVQPGPFDLVVTGQGRVTIASQDGNGVPGIVSLRGDRHTLHALSGQQTNRQTMNTTSPQDTTQASPVL